ncbi:hypothetical protein ABTM47_19680, partial [Acinetobacter baumannii]
RVKNLARLKMMNDEMVMRAMTGRQLGVDDDDALERAVSDTGGKVMVVDDHPRSSIRLAEALGQVFAVTSERDPVAAMERLATEPFDLVLV